MKIHATSVFKDPAKGRDFLENWYKKFQQLNGKAYEKIILETALGKTIVWAANKESIQSKALVVFPGFRTCSLFWDFENRMSELKKNYRVYWVETNGQPTHSEGNTPDIKSDDYGIWAAEVLEKLGLESAVVAGASFGGLVCLKLSMVAPQKVEKVVLLNPGCLAPFSLSWRNLYYNMLPILFPSEKNVTLFLDNAVFYKEHHTLKGEAKNLIVEYEEYVLKNFIDKGQKPYAMSEKELHRVSSDVYLVLGEKDLLFPALKSKAIAEKNIRSVKKVYMLPDTGHGIETSVEAMKILEEVLTK